MTQTLLLVEDNPNIMRINATALEMRGYQVMQATTLADARAQFAAQRPDLLVLDIMMPDGSGLDFCAEVRQNSDVPILLLSALGENQDIIHGLQTGGDDYLPKPYDLDVLIARIEAILRRSRLGGGRTQSETRADGPPSAQTLAYGPLTLDISALTARVAGRDVHLTPREFALLLALVKEDGQVISTKELYGLAWGMRASDDLHAVRVQISRLRAKLRQSGAGAIEILSERGKGYKVTLLE